MPAAAPVLRRFVVLCALGLWLGGLTFYALRVIRAAHQVVGSHLKVGFITRQATADLNLIWAGALALMLGNAALSWSRAGVWTRRSLATTWIVGAAAHVGVFILHARLESLLDLQTRQIREGVSFHGPHETYLIATSIEWAAGLAYLLVCLAAWRREDSITPDRT